MLPPKLYKAAKEGDVHCLSEIDGRNITEEEAMNNQHGNFLRRTQYGNNNILHIAARAGRDNFVAEVLCRFPFLSDQVNSQGDTPLLVAARFGHLKVVETLVAADHQFDRLPINSKQGTTALHEALRNRHEDVALYLLEVDPEMATFDNRASESPLFLAAESRCEKFVKKILLSQRPYSTKGPNGLNALHAVRNCNDTIISELITQRPDLMRQLDEHGKAAIHYAIEANYWVLLYQMLKADATITLFPDADGYTPLLIACNRGCWNVCQKMLEICPESIEARNREGQNALHLCKFRTYCERKFFMIPEIQELLNVGDDDGNTPLHLAAKENAHVKALFLLSTDEIDFWAVNKDGFTALDIWETQWINSTRQVLWWTWIPFIRYKLAQHGRRPNVKKDPAADRTAKPILESVTSTMFLVATLIATVTFAAAFTMPGGFDTSAGNAGVAILVKKAALRAFILSDTIAMCCSITVVFLLMEALIFGNDAVWTSATVSLTLLSTALTATLVAFMSGIFAVIAPKALWVAILVRMTCIVAPLALHLHETLYAIAILVMPGGVLVRDFIETIQRVVLTKRKREQDDARSMSNTNTEV